jgi:hypothetical protein
MKRSHSKRLSKQIFPSAASLSIRKRNFPILFSPLSSIFQPLLFIRVCVLPRSAVLYEYIVNIGQQDHGGNKTPPRGEYPTNKTHRCIQNNHSAAVSSNCLFLVVADLCRNRYFSHQDWFFS